MNNITLSPSYRHYIYEYYKAATLGYNAIQLHLGCIIIEYYDFLMHVSTSKPNKDVWYQ